MSHIPIPSTIEDAPEESQFLLKDLEAKMGSTPNLFRLLAISPHSLAGYVNLSTSLSDGSLDAAIGERIALAIAELNGCEYCLAAHSYLGAHVAKLTETEMTTNRHGSSGDSKAAVAVAFATNLAQQRGEVSREDVAAVLEAGFSQREIIEIISHVALNTLTNYLNRALATEIDFPPVHALND